MKKSKNAATNSSRWQLFWRGASSKWLLGIPVGAWVMFAFGLFSMIGFEVVLHKTGTEEFCTTACHSMTSYTVPEWRESIHYKNRSGVKAACPDCHIPKSYPEYLWAKAYDGTRHLIGEIVGSIDTPEKYEQRRLIMAERVWRIMKSSDSRECRSCHIVESMQVTDQDQRASRAHSLGLAAGETCIDCHKGIAHVTPEEAALEL
ncbi:MAG: cytochrome c-type protein YecK [Gammaproteobacteria bacterium]|nr:MAG: cytochrome c-type protein YecK [Gammaproteobacteria bacterium]RLA35643.1 MAG: cytochrome c-type protein YecK [Gammaproteobacteria bacterium]